jgi:hypothetical protein
MDRLFTTSLIEKVRKKREALAAGVEVPMKNIVTTSCVDVSRTFGFITRYDFISVSIEKR